jgi:alpha-mannosidase
MAELNRRQFIGASASLLPLWGTPTRKVYVVPNFHPASCGWLTNFSKERVYCANSYFDHLDKVRDDPQYAFVLSEVNNMIAMMNFRPERMPELKRRIKEGHVELVNGYFLESAINLSGGEALVRLGVEGIRWQKQMFGVRPRFGWNIDVCGTHDQMAQITAGLGFDAIVYTRKNPTGSAVHWAESPDGTRALALSPGHYSELGVIFAAKERLTEKQLEEVGKEIAAKVPITPEGAPILILGGAGDYALAPAYKQNPSEFLRQWSQFQPATELHFATLSKYLDAILPAVKSGAMHLPTMRGGTAYDFDSFWIECPKMKSWFRRDEHALAAAEAVATAASLTSKYAYPTRTLYDAWLLLFLSMDRNTLWGAAGGMVFEHERSWDARDRLEWVERTAHETQKTAARAIAGDGDQTGIFNPLNWGRNDPVILELGEESSLAGIASQALADGSTLCQFEIPSMGVVSCKRDAQAAAVAKTISLPDAIETKFYDARVDGKTGALVSLKLKPSGREMLGGPANEILFERCTSQNGDPGDFTLPRSGRRIVARSSDSPVSISVASGPLATTVTVEGSLPQAGVARRKLRFYQNHPRIDFETELNDIPNLTVVTTEFPLQDSIRAVRRGIPYGFSHGAWAQEDPNLHGWTKGITPAVRWSHYEVDGGGVALLDRGLSGRELVGQTPILFLYNATDKYYGYPNPWLSGEGKHVLSYALYAYEGDWRTARVPHMAFEFNAPPVLIPATGEMAAHPFLETSENVIVEGFHREGRHIEIRLVECLGYAGTATLSVRLPHRQAFLTDMVGGNPKPLRAGPRYSFPIRAQQIVTMRLLTDSAAEESKLRTRWDDLVPENKQAMLYEYSNVKGHPPRGA